MGTYLITRRLPMVTILKLVTWRTVKSKVPLRENAKLASLFPITKSGKCS